VPGWTNGWPSGRNSGVLACPADEAAPTVASSRRLRHGPSTSRTRRWVRLESSIGARSRGRLDLLRGGGDDDVERGVGHVSDGSVPRVVGQALAGGADRREACAGRRDGDHRAVPAEVGDEDFLESAPAERTQAGDQARPGPRSCGSSAGPRRSCAENRIGGRGSAVTRSRALCALSRRPRRSNTNIRKTAGKKTIAIQLGPAPATPRPINSRTPARPRDALDRRVTAFGGRQRDREAEHRRDEVDRGQNRR